MMRHQYPLETERAGNAGFAPTRSGIPCMTISPRAPSAAHSRDGAIVAELCELQSPVRHISLADCTTCLQWRVAFAQQAF
jgi:hypothetical protein